MNKYKVYVTGFDAVEIEASWYKFEDGKLVFENHVGTLTSPSGYQTPIIKIKAIFNQWAYIEML